jgi:hypothetical protein
MFKAKEARKNRQSDAPIILGRAIQHLNDAELATLKAVIDPAALGLVGLSIGNRGEVVDRKGRKIHKPGFRDAVEKVLFVQVK